MTRLRVASSGVTLLQDKGRADWANEGVPRSGAWNIPLYLDTVRLLIGSESTSLPVFEILGGTFTVVAEENHPLHIACTGSAFLSVDGQPMPTGTLLLLGSKARTTITVQHLGSGVAYLAVAGLQVDAVLGSAATDTFSQLGPSPVRLGDEFPLSSDTVGVEEGRFLRPDQPSPSVSLRFLPHEGGEFFLCGRKWAVQSNARSGTRLHQPSIRPDVFPRRALASHPVVPGTIQVPPSGEPIVLGPDSGVTGGYPTAGSIITADLHLLAGLPSGTLVSFVSSTITQAHKAYADMLAKSATSVVDISKIQQMTTGKMKQGKKPKHRK